MGVIPLRRCTVKGRFVLTLSCLLFATGAAARIHNVTDADAPRALPEQGPVTVRWEDPEQFTEIRYSHNPTESRRGDWVEQLALYLRKRAQPRLAAGERLEVIITNIERAGDFEPWLGINFHDTRIVRDYYPPRMELHFRLIDANGRVREGERKLTDAGFMQTSMRDNDLLRFEKDLIDRWLQRELPTPARASR
jgi:DUF3016 family protein